MLTLVKNARADSVARTGSGRWGRCAAGRHMADGRVVEGSHALMTVGSVPNTAGLGLDRVGIDVSPGGYIPVDRVSRTVAAGSMPPGTAPGCFRWRRWPPCRAGSRCTTRWARGCPRFDCRTVASAAFTQPEIAAVGVPQTAIDLRRSRPARSCCR